MSKTGIAVVCAFSIVSTACAVRPLPEQVTGVTTAEIVSAIRCETRDSIVTQATEIWDDFFYDDVSLAEKHALAEEILDILNQAQNRRLIFNVDLDKEQIIGLIGSAFAQVGLESYVDPNKRDSDSLSRRGIDVIDHIINKIAEFALHGVAFGFDFDITETNNATASATFNMPWTPGNFSLKANAGSKKDRQNKRTFTINQPFMRAALIECENGVQPSFYHYPIAGKIEINEILNTYFLLTDDEDSGSIGDFVDKITYTTKLEAGADPSVSLNPLPAGFHIASANGEIDLVRNDIHSVTITISDPRKEVKDARFRLSAASRNALQILNREIDRESAVSQRDLERALLLR